jgi:catechol 2,3-dioxygenase-like lactoylglutathione lyase family enzyme
LGKLALIGNVFALNICDKSRHDGKMIALKVIPVMKCNDMPEALSFYTKILGFELLDAWPPEAPVYCALSNADVVINLSTNSGDGIAGNVVFIAVRGLDDLFKTFIARGLDTTKKKESPVHQGPLDQTWGWREFYVTDPSGNTLRFGEKL